MALVERLMGLEEPKIPVHDFFAACLKVAMGKRTVAQIKTVFAMNAAAQAEFDALVALAPAGTNATALANRALYVEDIHATFVLAESGYQTFSTPSEIRAELGI